MGTPEDVIEHSVLAMVVSMVGACGLRVLWVLTIFARFHSLETLYWSYPITWTVTFFAHMICFWIVKRKF